MATLLGINIELNPWHDGAFPWQAMAIGDRCLFVVREGGLELSFPIDDAAQFNNTPSLICSNSLLDTP